MSQKEWTAVMLLVSQAVVLAWLVWDAMTAEIWPGPVHQAAAKLLWAIGAMIVINIVSAIVSAIVVSIVTQREYKEERADERDQAVYARSLRNAYFAASIGGIMTLFTLAFGYDPAIAANVLFGGLMVAGAADNVSQLLYYRLS